MNDDFQPKDQSQHDLRATRHLKTEHESYRSYPHCLIDLRYHGPNTSRLHHQEEYTYVLLQARLSQLSDRMEW